MNKIIQFTALLILIITAASCRENFHMIKGQGITVTNSRTLSGFDAVALSMDADLELVQDSVFSIELQGQQNILNLIETRVKGNTLHINLENFISIRGHDPIKIVIHMPSLRMTEISGSGNIRCQNNFISSNFTTHISGSGDMSFKGNISSYCKADISGSGNIHFETFNDCSQADFNISGSGSIHAENLHTQSIDASISGSGNMTVYTISTLDADIAGSGTIWYRGNPVITSNISGSGKIKPLY